MKAIRILGRSIRDAFKSVIRNFSLSMASILCVTITLIIMSVAIIVACNIKESTKTIEEEMHIIVYMKNEATDEDKENLELEIKNTKNVREVEYISKESQKQSMEEYDELFKTLLDYLDVNPLLSSFIIYVDDIEKMSDTADDLKELPNVETVKYGEQTVEEVVGAFDVVEKITLGIVIAMLLVTIFLISNTIKLTIFSRRSEIEIMRLVGASNTAIRLPFLFEGLIIGIIGSIIPVCITIYGYVILNNAMNGHIFTELLKLIEPYNFVFYVSGVLILIGAIVGMLSSGHSVRRYLKI